MSTLRTDAIVDLAGNGKPDLSNGVQIGGVAVTSTAAELNILDGVTSTAAELNILDGVTSTAAELNILDGVTSTAAELNILDGVTSTAAELNILDGVTSTAAELNILDGVTATAAEINLIDGGTARGTTAVADGDGFLTNDGGTMRMTKVETLATYMGTKITGVPAGSVIYYAKNAAPTGFLKANGAAISRSTYSALFSAIGTVFGVGDGSSTFNVPDLRGEFIRGWDDGKGTDDSRGFGSAQADAFQGHEHGMITAQTIGQANFTKIVAGDTQYAVQNLVTTSIVNKSGSGTARPAAETRPRNLALLACIKI